MMKLFLCLCVVLALLQGAYSANILALIPFPAKSHAIFAERLVQALDEKGHSLTLLTSEKPQIPLGKTKIIELKNIRPKMLEQWQKFSGTKDLFESRKASSFSNILGIPTMGLMISETILQDEKVVKLIQSSEKFDLVIGEVFGDESLLAGFSHRFQAPLIALHSFMTSYWANFLVGNPAPAAFVPDPFLGHSNRMSFIQRVENFLFGTFGEFYHRCIYLPKQDAIMRKYFSHDMPAIEDILKNTSFVFTNQHYSIGFPRPYVPNMIEVAGMHVRPPKELPADLKTYMDNSKDGVVLFAMGSNLRTSDLSPQMIEDILAAFSRLKQNVLWKFEKQLDNLPKNVKIMEWLPQSDLLAHPNMKVFITHGGLMSVIESIDRGIPVVGIPIFGDQPMNMRHTENAGLGITLNFDDLNEDSLYNSVTEVLNNPKYNRNAKEKSRLLKDTPMSPMESATWWVDYVIRHKGARHMRSAAQDLAWYELYLLDVYAISAVILVTIAAVNICIVKAICRRFCKKCCTKKDAKTNSKNDSEKKRN